MKHQSSTSGSAAQLMNYPSILKYMITNWLRQNKHDQQKERKLFIGKKYISNTFMCLTQALSPVCQHPAPLPSLYILYFMCALEFEARFICHFSFSVVVCVYGLLYLLSERTSCA